MYIMNDGQKKLDWSGENDFTIEHQLEWEHL